MTISISLYLCLVSKAREYYELFLLPGDRVARCTCFITLKIKTLSIRMIVRKQYTVALYKKNRLGYFWSSLLRFYPFNYINV